MVQELAKRIVRQAVAEKAQDIYIVPNGISCDVNIRVGGQKKHFDTVKPEMAMQLMSHFKFLAGMNVGEKRRCQLGAYDYPVDKKEVVSLRFSTVGDYKGDESMVIRLLQSNHTQLQYWFQQDQALKKHIQKRGLYLFSGPVGSGKTSLMYELLNELPSLYQVLTIEDPVEIKKSSILQLQVNKSIGLTYDELIKLSLRHRPDILIIGEIRDSETAKAVVRASLTGARVYSTIHAKSIPGVYARLLELGVSKDELSNCLQLIAYQRILNKGGLIDFATENFKTYSHHKWNQWLDQLFKQGHITDQERTIEKIIDQKADSLY